MRSDSFRQRTIALDLRTAFQCVQVKKTPVIVSVTNHSRVLQTWKCTELNLKSWTSCNVCTKWIIESHSFYSFIPTPFRSIRDRNSDAKIHIRKTDPKYLTVAVVEASHTQTGYLSAVPIFAYLSSHQYFPSRVLLSCSGRVPVKERIYCGGCG